MVGRSHKLVSNVAAFMGAARQHQTLPDKGFSIRYVAVRVGNTVDPRLLNH